MPQRIETPDGSQLVARWLQRWRASLLPFTEHGRPATELAGSHTITVPLLGGGACSQTALPLQGLASQQVRCRQRRRQRRAAGKAAAAAAAAAQHRLATIDCRSIPAIKQRHSDREAPWRLHFADLPEKVATGGFPNACCE